MIICESKGETKVLIMGVDMYNFEFLYKNWAILAKLGA